MEPGRPSPSAQSCFPRQEALQSVPGRPVTAEGSSYWGLEV